MSVPLSCSRDEVNSSTNTPGLSACFKFNYFSKFTSFGESCSDDDTVITSLQKIVPVLNLNYCSSTLITDKIFYRGYYLKEVCASGRETLTLKNLPVLRFSSS